MKRLLGVGVLALLALTAWLLRREPVSSGPIPSAAALPAQAASAPAMEPPNVDADRTEVAGEHEAPVPAATPASDPTEADLAPFARSCPPGTIEGIVLFGTVPVSGGRAWIAGESTGGLPWGPPVVWDADGTVSRAPIGPDGVFRFEGLRPDTYGVGVETTDGRTRHVFCTLRSADTSSPRVRIVLGSGGVRGHVYDERGLACAGWQVAVNTWGPGIADTQIIDGAETDREGAFEFPGLLGGRYVLTVWPNTDFQDPLRRTASFDLPPATWMTVDLGTPRAAVLWTGRVLLPRRELLELLQLVELVIETDGVRSRAAVSSSAFQARIPPGLHPLGISVGNRGVLAIHPITAPEHDFVEDVVLPAALVRVRATYRGGRPDAERELRWFRLTLKSAAVAFEGEVGAQGQRFFLAVPPGDYALRCTTHPIQGAPGGSLPVHVAATDDEIDVDVVLGDG